jgi:hypothetical protein
LIRYAARVREFSFEIGFAKPRNIIGANNKPYLSVDSDAERAGPVAASVSLSFRAISIPHWQEKYRRRSVECCSIGIET